jgi:hypothetical protein
MTHGRPLRSLAKILGGWTALRLAMALPVPATMMASQPMFVEIATPKPSSLAWMFPSHSAVSATAAAPPAEQQFVQSRAMPHVASTGREPPAPASALAAAGGWSSAVADSLLGAQMAFARTPRAPLALAAFAPGSGLSPREAGVPGPPAAAADRWSGAAWMIWRREGVYDQPMLAGSQAGMRIDYALDPGSALRPALYGRVSSAITSLAAAEVAAGVAIRPRLPIPITLAVERRQAISRGGRNDFAVVAAGGMNPTDIGQGFRIDGYGQAGMVGIRQRDAFVDGRITVERPVAGPDLAVGAAMWGGAQPGTSRLDIGPQASLRLRVGGASLRLGAEWRAQVAGNATPSSGPVLSIGSDF